MLLTAGVREWTYFSLATAALREKLASLPSSSAHGGTRVVTYESLAHLQRDEQAYERVRDMVGGVHGEGGSGHPCSLESILEDDSSKPEPNRARYLLYYVRGAAAEPSAAAAPRVPSAKAHVMQLLHKRTSTRDEELRRLLPPDHDYQKQGCELSQLESQPRNGGLGYAAARGETRKAHLRVVHAVVHSLAERQRRIAEHLQLRAGGDTHAPSTVFTMDTRERVEHEMYLRDAQVHGE